MRIFGDEFVAGRLVLQVLALGIFFNVAVGPIGWFIVLTGRSYLSLINSLVALLVNISVTFFLTTKFGIIGAAIAILLGLLVINVMRLIQIKSIFGIHPFSTAMWKSIGDRMHGSFYRIRIKSYRMAISFLSERLGRFRQTGALHTLLLTTALLISVLMRRYTVFESIRGLMITEKYVF